jgi:hypothetical protein
VEEAAEALGISPASAYRDWAFAGAWLLHEMRGEGTASAPARLSRDGSKSALAQGRPPALLALSLPARDAKTLHRPPRRSAGANSTFFVFSAFSVSCFAPKSRLGTSSPSQPHQEAAPMTSSTHELASTPQARTALALPAARAADQAAPGGEPPVLRPPPSPGLTLGPPGDGYALTEGGAELARPPRRAQAGDPGRAPARGAADGPHWDGESRELRLGGQLVLRLLATATAQARLLRAFQEKGWPPDIANPLRGEPNAVQRLVGAAKGLNRRRQEPLLEFYTERGRLGWRRIPAP